MGSITEDGANPGDFSVNTTGMSATVTAGNSTTFAVTFTPTASGARAAALHIANNDSNENPFDIALTGTDQTPFEEWAIANGLPTDPAANGGQNLLNFAFGLNPDGSSTGVIAVVGGVITQRGTATPRLTGTPNGVDFKALFGRRKNSGLTYTVQFSADLAGWENNTVQPVVIADDGLIEACTVPYPFFLSDGQKARFFRVSVQ